MNIICNFWCIISTSDKVEHLQWNGEKIQNKKIGYNALVAISNTRVITTAMQTGCDANVPMNKGLMQAKSLHTGEKHLCMVGQVSLYLSFTHFSYLFILQKNAFSTCSFQSQRKLIFSYAVPSTWNEIMLKFAISLHLFPLTGI